MILWASLLALPIALYLLVQGELMPFVIAIIGLGRGLLITMALVQRRQYERAAFGQVYTALIIGLVLTLVDPQIVDFGLATGAAGAGPCLAAQPHARQEAQPGCCCWR